LQGGTAGDIFFISNLLSSSMDVVEDDFYECFFNFLSIDDVRKNPEKLKD
jgi:hypothetical protein